MSEPETSKCSLRRTTPLRSVPSSSFASAALRSICGLSEEVAPIKLQQIEHVIDEAVGLAVLERVLQRREIADAVLLDHDLAVDHRGVGVELLRPRPRPA